MQRSRRPAEVVVSSSGQHDEETSLRVEGAATRNEAVLARRSSPIHSKSSRKQTNKLDPALKSWLDNVIIPALVREYLAEIEKRNRLATFGGSEVPSD